MSVPIILYCQRLTSECKLFFSQSHVYLSVIRSSVLLLEAL